MSKDTGDTNNYYTGCHITRDRKARESKLDQGLYVKSMLETFIYSIDKASRILYFSGVPTLQKADESQTRKRRKRC